jgi:hypothetical protein
MASDSSTGERLQQFLRELTPPTRTLLVAELERGVLRGDETPTNDLVLDQLRRLLRDNDRAGARISNAARLFYKPLEPFLVDDVAEHQHPGRISRTALEPMWNWLRRDLLPQETEAFSDAVSKGMLANDNAKLEAAARAYQDRAAQKIDEMFVIAQRDDRVRRRLFAQIGTPRAIDDATALMRVLKARDFLAKSMAQLPGHIDNLADARLDEVKALVDSITKTDRKLFIYALLLVMNRLAAPWQLIRLAVRAAGSDNVMRVSETPYEVAVAIVLAEIGRLVGELKADLKSRKLTAVVSLLKFIHDAARGMKSELDLGESPWGRELAALRGQISDVLKGEIDLAAGRVRKLLRPRPSAEIRANSVLEPEEVAETEALMDFVVACKHFGSELAIAEPSQRAYADLKQFLDAGMSPLLDGLRHAGEGDRAFRQSQVDASVRFCNKIFGPDYGSALGKAALVAAGERQLASA